MRDTDSPALEGKEGESDRLYTPRELSNYLRVTRKTICRYLIEGMPHERLGPYVRFHLPAVMAWLRTRSTTRKPPRKRP